MAKYTQIFVLIYPELYNLNYLVCKLWTIIQNLETTLFSYRFDIVVHIYVTCSICSLQVRVLVRRTERCIQYTSTVEVLIYRVRTVLVSQTVGDENYESVLTFTTQFRR